MYSMQAVFRRGINNATTQFDRMGYVANNLSNQNTNGYKSVRFEQMLSEDGYLNGAIRTDYKQGGVRITNNPYDIALNEEGFIPVVSPEGEVAYTRDGSLKIGKEGYLMTNDDWLIGSGIKVPAGSYKISVKPNGDVLCYDAVDSPAKNLGTIPVVRFQMPEGLEQGSNNKMLKTEESGEPALVRDHQMISQHGIETANIDIYGQVTEMLRLNASMLASMKMMKLSDSMYNKAINIRQG